jgi:hypothetical protein
MKAGQYLVLMPLRLSRDTWSIDPQNFERRDLLSLAFLAITISNRGATPRRLRQLNPISVPTLR